MILIKISLVFIIRFYQEKDKRQIKFKEDLMILSF